MNGMFYKIAGIGALIWLVGMIIGASGRFSLQYLATLSGIGAIIAGVGILLVGLGFFGIWKSNANLFPMLTMIFGFIAGIMILIEGILVLAAPGAIGYAGTMAAFTLAAFFIGAGISLHSLEAIAKTMFLHEASILSLASAVVALGVFGLTMVNLAVMPVTLFYVIVFFKM